MNNYTSNQQQKKNIMNFPLIQLSVALFGASIMPLTWAANLKTMDASSLSGNRVELKLTFDEPIANPKGYTIDQPARIALDLKGVTNQLGTKRRVVDIGDVKSLTLVEAKDITRLVVNLNTLVSYTTRNEGNVLYVVLGGDAKTASSNNTPPTTSKTLTTRTTTVSTSTANQIQSTAGKSIQNIDFRRGSDGEGSVVIKLSDRNITPDIQDKGDKIVLNFANAQLPEALRLRLDVKDFATPVQYINSVAKGNGSSITIEPKGSYDYLVFQADNELTVSVKHISAEEKQQRLESNGVFKGNTLSLNFQDIEVRSVLQILADFTKLNLVATDSVQGNITLRLQNVPWDQALDIIMRTKGLAKRQEGNILIIAPADELAATEHKRFEAEQTIKAVQPLRREMIQINYANAADIVALFQGAVTKSDTQGAAALEDRGSLTVDKRTNTIIANQTEDRLNELKRIIAQLDKPVRQVQIEARIVEANVSFAKSLGVRWGADVATGRWREYGGGDGRVSLSDASGTTSSGSMGNYMQYDDEKNTYLPGGSVPSVDLAVTNATSGFGVGYIGSHIMLDLKLNAMQKSGQGEIISQPKVTTADKETAKIMKGQEVPYQEASSSGATTTSFKDATLSLEVTPQITPDNQIMMTVVVTKDSVATDQISNTGVPAINKNEVNAKVQVADGETIVIGGVFQNTQSKVVEKVPFLGDLPVLGRLFRRDTVDNSKQELLVFITPRIIDNKAFVSRQ